MRKTTLLCLFIFSCFFSFAQQWSIPGTMVAGGNGAGSAADQLNAPSDIKVSATGAMYITDLSNGRIQKWDPGATQGTTVASGLLFPIGIDLADEGGETVMYITNAGNHEVVKWIEGESSGTVVAGGNGAGAGLNQLFYPTGIVKHGDDLFIVDSGNARVVKWEQNATQGIVVAGGNGFGNANNQLGVPMLTGFIYVDDAETVFVTEYSNDRVSRWAAGDNFGSTAADITTTGASNVRVSGITFLQGKMLLTYSQAMATNPDGRKVTIWDNSTYIGDAISTASGELIEPFAITLDANNNMYIVESSGGGVNGVKKFDLVPGSLSEADPETQEIALYPNPTHGIIELQKLPESQVKSITVYNSIGQMVKQVNTTNRIDISAFNAGIYYMQIQQSSGKNQTTKVVKL